MAESNRCVTISDAKKILCDGIMELSISTENESEVTVILLVIAVMTGIFSCPELTMLLGPYWNSKTVRNRLNILSQKGYISKVVCDWSDMDARIAYRILPKGYRYILDRLPNWMKTDGVIKVKRMHDDDTFPKHQYGVGISFLSLLQVGRQFRFYKEFEISSNSSGKKNAGSLWVDAVVVFDSERKRFYVEQDSGTENYNVLEDKLRKYVEGGKTERDMCIIFACHRPYSSAAEPCFRQSKVQPILGAMEQHGLSLYQYYLEKENEMDIDTLITIKKLLAVTDVCSVEGEISKIDYDSPVKRKAIHSPIFYYQFSDRTEDMSIQRMREYLCALKNGNNSYASEYYKNKQLLNANKRLIGLATYIWNQIDNYNYYDVFAYLLRHNCYVAPSISVDVVADRFMSDQYLDEKIMGLLKKYYPNIYDAEKIDNLFTVLEIEKYHIIEPYMTLKTPENTLLLIEYVDHNLSAAMRMKFISRLRAKPGINSITFICLADDYDIIYRLAEFVGVNKVLEKRDDIKFLCARLGNSDDPYWLMNFIDKKNTGQLQTAYPREMLKKYRMIIESKKYAKEDIKSIHEAMDMLGE